MTEPVPKPERRRGSAPAFPRGADAACAGETVHGLFAAQAARTPAAEALVSGEERVTFRELDRRSDRLARRLQEMGVELEDRVAVCMERSAGLIVALVAALKSGGAYVPIDPAYPRDRQAFMLEDSGATFLLTDRRSVVGLPAFAGVTLLLDGDGDGETAPDLTRTEPAAEPPVSVSGPDNLAYVIYTSGSTGTPKGTAIEHRAACAFLDWAATLFTRDELSGVLAATSVCFDLSVFEIFLPLAAGGRILLARDALALPEIAARDEVRLVNTVPSAVTELVRAGAIPPGVTTVNLAGEPLRRALADRIYALGHVARVYNLYGPTEDTTYSTWSLVPRGIPDPPAIGRPIAGTRAHLCGPGLEPVAEGAAGELYLSGLGLARGYLGRPEVTAQRFTPDPFSPRPGQRMYATGDLARYGADGELQYIGRIDHQVKIRGFRIEPGEVQAVLERQPQVAETLVVAREVEVPGEEGEGEKVLVAYVRPAPGAELGRSALRSYLAERLPAHMVPAYFVFLESFPQTPNGKVDRAALPEPRAELAEDSAWEIEGPVGELEEGVAQAWREVLGLPRVGRRDDFFALGGHSLAAARIRVRLREILGVELAPRLFLENPTIEMQGRLVGERRGERAELAGARPGDVEERGEETEPGLTLAQEALWVADRAHPDLPLFTISYALDFDGPLSPTALAWAVAESVRLHPDLNLVFEEREGRPYPRRAPSVGALPWIDLRELGAERALAAADALEGEASRTRIALDRGPLLQAHLLSIAPGRWRLLVRIHHLVFDDWSARLWLGDLSALYSAAVGGPAEGRSRPDRGSTRAAAWQRGWVASAEGRGQTEHWLRLLREAPLRLHLPFDRPRPAERSLKGEMRVTRLGERQVLALAGLARQARTTLFGVLLAGYAAWLHRLTDEPDLTISAPFANREHRGSEDVVGLFTNALPIRSRVGDGESFGELLTTTRDTLLAALDHQGVPAEHLLRELGLEPSGSHAPLAQVGIVYQEGLFGPEPWAGGVTLRLRELANGVARLDLLLYVREVPGGLGLHWELDSALFDGTTVLRFATQLEALLESAVREPEQALVNLPLWREPEGHQLRVGWNDTASRLSVTPVQESFARLARRNPDWPALIGGGRSLTYGELLLAAERLGERLRRQGVGTDTLVAVALEPSFEMPAALLAVLLAGGAYLPLDPAYPEERLAFMLADSGARLLVTTSPLASRFPGFAGAVVLLDGPESAAGEPPSSGWLRPALPSLDSLAYVIYTSGSTGRPKGVMVAHRGLINLADAQVALFDLKPGRRQLQFASFSFDASVSEIFTALVSGASLVFAERPELLPGEPLARLLAASAVTTLTLPPSALAVLDVVAPGGEGLPALSTLIVAGEACPPDLARRWSAGRRWLNAYGPTEATVCATAAVGVELDGAFSIGRPIANTRVLVLDRRLQPAPIGMPGQIVLAGIGLARGYLGRPELTAERFLPALDVRENGTPGERMYLTGDLGRRLADGRIEFLGRIDRQVKLRGFRVELGEVEAALRQLPAVREAVVGVRDAGGSAARLAAYLVPAEGSLPPASELRRSLLSRLPEHMVPAHFLSLPALPLTPNGKIDRAALAALPLNGEQGAGRSVPVGPIEEMLAGVWSELLGFEPGRIGRSEGFFDLGGHSLIATQVLARIRRTFGVELPYRVFFTSPTVATLAERIERSLRAGRGDELPEIFRAPRRGAFPASFAQRRLWLLQRLDPLSAAYNVPDRLRFRGPLQTWALEAALRQLARRHESLRTRFFEEDGRPYQEIGGEGFGFLPKVDLGALPAAAGRAEAERLSRAEAGRPFDLGTAPLFRALLLTLHSEGGEAEHQLFLDAHHIVTDGWSQGLLQSELGALYADLLAGRIPDPAPGEKLQYVDFAVWQERYWTEAFLRRQLDYWRARLQGLPEALDLPLDHPRPPVWSGRGQRVEVAIGSGGRLREAARREGVTPFLFLLAVFDVFLSRTARQPVVAVGSPALGRGREELERIVGFFVNTLVLRADLSEGMAFRDLLAQGRTALLEAHENQDLPFDRVVEELAPQRSLAHSPLIQAMLSLERSAFGTRFPGELAIEALPVETGTAKFDLFLALEEGEGAIGGWLEYGSDLFDRTTVVRWAGHLGRIVERVLDRPDLAVAEISLLSAAETAQLRVEWNSESEVAWPEGLLHQGFERQAEITPDAVAVLAKDRTLTYRELEAHSRALALELRAVGAGPEAPVAVLLDRGSDLIVALFAVLRSGAPYLPLDPAYPEERLRFMAADAGARWLLTSKRLWEAGPLLPESVVPLFVDAERLRGIEESVAGWAPPDVQPGNLAYLIYTSGSTGRPKGVAIEHRSAAAFVAWALTEFSRAELAGVLAATSICFDLSIFEIFVPLAAGGTLVLADNALDLAALPLASAVTLVNTVPSAMAELIRLGALPPSVRTVNLAGEPLPRALADEILALPAVGRLLNLYGPSEDTTYSTWGAVEARSVRPPGIGRPLAGSRVRLLDSALQEVAAGVPGALYLGGAGLARGYLGRPDLTAERFVPDPYGHGPGARLYFTGDLARYAATGEIDFLGRLDHQVKVRGFRIELGEIEAGLRADPAVAECVVLARGGPESGGDLRLVAYVVPAPDATLAVAELREELGRRLPAYMVPEAWVVLDALPLTPNGKVDRKALPAPELAAAERGPKRSRTPAEELVAGIWSEVLGLGSGAWIDGAASFFDLGGHSLLAARVVARLRSALGIELPLRSLFESPSLAGFARLSAAAERGGTAATGVRIERRTLSSGERREVVPASLFQRGLWFLDQLAPGLAVYNLPVALRLDGPLDAPALRGALRALELRHAALRSTFETRQGEPHVVVEPVASGSLLEVDLSALLGSGPREEEARRLLAAEALRPFVLERGPLFRSLLLKLREGEHHLLLSLHHIISDAGSVEVLLRDLGVAYAMEAGSSARGVGEPAGEPNFEPLPFDYADFALAQRRWHGSADFERQLDFWRRRLAGAPATLELPVDRPRPPRPSYRGSLCRLELSGAAAAQLREFCRRSVVTLPMAGHAAFAELLGRYARQEDVVVGSAAANRGQEGLERIVGYFVNTVVLRLDLGGDPTFETLLARAREAALSAWSHQDLPFELLVEELKPERDPARVPYCQVMFNVARSGRSARPASLAEGLTQSPLSVDLGIAKFDLTLTLEEGDGEGGQALAVTLEAASDLYDETTARRFLGHFGALLESAAAEPWRPRSERVWLQPAELHQVIRELSDTRRLLPARACIHLLVAEAARRNPEAVALVWGDGADQTLTYADLERRAAAMARSLRRLGVGPDVLVGVAVERSPELVVALLAVLKAGGAFVPLDTGYPRERLAWLLADTESEVLVADQPSLAKLPPLPEGLRVLRVGGLDSESWAQGSFDLDLRAELEADPDNLAYVMYTSGTTGRPKGVAVPHRAVVRLVRETDFARLGPDETFLLLAPVSFDASTLEIWGALANGARLAIYPRRKPEPGELASVLARQRVTFLWLTAGLFHQMVEHDVRAFAGVRQLFAGGDVLAPASVRKTLAANPGLTLTDGYGPTENTTFTTTHSMRSPGEVEEPVAIGRPIANSRVLLLDSDLRPVPVGVPGELYCGGEGLARGFLRRPGLTAERFVPDPLAGGGAEEGARLYRTGDLARYLADGRIEFLGRIDSQVKIRGFRIELEEIETVLAAHPEVAQAVVAARSFRAGSFEDRRLVAYVVLREGSEAAGGGLRRTLGGYLRERLPDYMIPAAWVELAELPLDPNGKVNRRALPEPLVEAGGSEGEGREPGSPTEELLLGLWADLLGAPRVGRDDGFFDLGGHSLLATQAISRLREMLGVEVPLRQLFETPTVAGFAEALEALGGGEGSAVPSVHPAPAGEASELPLSFAQSRLWFLEELAPGDPGYVIPVPLRLEGRIDPAVLRAALTEVVRRHASLRTTFGEVEGEPVQRVAAPAEILLSRVDLTALPEGEGNGIRSAEIERLAVEDSLLPFDLGRGPLFRATLILEKGGDPPSAVLLLALHHIVSDGWSVDVLLREWAAIHGAFAAGLPSPLAEPALQYGDFAVWQRRWQGGDALAGQLEYWRQRLSAAPAALELPADRPRPAIQSSRGASVSFHLTALESAALRRACRREDATLFMVMLAAFHWVLGSSAHQEDVLVGTAIANRTRRETEDLIGFFVNTLVLRSDLSGEPSFRDLLRATRETALSAYAHQDLPFERMVEELRPERDLSRSPFFQAFFSLRNASPELPGPPGVRVTGLDLESRVAKFDLSLAAADEGGGVWLGLEYNRDLFDRTTALRLLERYRRSLLAAANEPERKLAELPLLGAAEEHQLLREWNETHLPSGREGTLAELFAAQAFLSPGAVALVDGTERLTYAELDARVDRLTQRLLRLGATRERLVAVLLGRRADLIAALLAIHRAGAAYVAIDLAYPEARARYLLENSRAEILVTRRDLAAERGAVLPRHLPVLFVDEESDDGAGAEPLPLPRLVPEQLAYVIYTSGSTGQPKGVAIEHRAAVAFVRWARQAFSAEERAGVLAATSVCFDLSVFEIFATLAWGGKVILAKNALALRTLPAASEVTLVNTVPSAMVELLAEEAIPEGVRTINLAGEPLPLELAHRIHAFTKAGRLLNLYGPSEDTTYSTFAAVPPGEGRPPAIGRPIAGTRAYLLDAALRPVPLGVVGALYLAGAGLARGYLGRPAATAERFVPDPFASGPGSAGARLYRTGDLARFRADGELEFLGRIDHQVKVRGYRIELGEIETVLMRHPALAECAVLAIPEAEGGARLAAFIVGRRGSEPGGALADSLRRLVKATLPEFMVPGVFVPLDALPLTPNGKVDRAALAALAPEVESAPAAPVTRGISPVEEVVSGIWSDVFGGTVGREEKFFDLGGHSLLAARVASRLRTSLRVELPLQKLFELPTVAQLSEWIEGELRRKGTVELPPIVPVPRDFGLPLSFAQQRLWFVDRMAPGSATFNLPAPLRLTGPLSQGLLAAALAEVVRRHETLRTFFEERQGRVLQRILPPFAVGLPLADLSGLGEPAAREEEAERTANAEARAPFDLSRGGLARFALVRLAPEEHLLLATFHHIVSDGWSTDLFAAELGFLYAALARGEVRPLADLPVQYADFAVWQRRIFEPEALPGLLSAWRRSFGDELPRLDLPTDRPRPAEQTYAGGYRTLELPVELAASLRAFARRRGATLFMTLLAAFQALLARISGQDRMALGTPIAGRTRPEVEGMIGCFVNTIVVPGDLAGDPSFETLVSRVRAAALAAYACEDLPFDKLVEVLQPERDRSRSALFQVMFSFQAAAVVPAAGAECGVAIEPYSIGTGTSQFDLTLFVAEALGAEGEPGLMAGIEYNLDLFDAATIDRMLSGYRNLLAGAMARPAATLSEMPLLEEERRAELSAEARELEARLAPLAGGSPLAVVVDEAAGKGGEIAVAIVSGGNPEVEDSVRTAAASSSMPVVVVTSAELPRLGSGEIDRLAVIQLAKGARLALAGKGSESVSDAPTAGTESRRDRLAERRAKLSGAQREALQERLRISRAKPGGEGGGE